MLSRTMTMDGNARDDETVYSVLRKDLSVVTPAIDKTYRSRANSYVSHTGVSFKSFQSAVLKHFHPCEIEGSISEIASQIEQSPHRKKWWLQWLDDSIHWETPARSELNQHLLEPFKCKTSPLAPLAMLYICHLTLADVVESAWSACNPNPRVGLVDSDSWESRINSFLPFFAMESW